MSLEERFRQSLAAAIDDVRAKLDAEFQAALADARAEADASKAAALAETRLAVEGELLRTFSAEKEALTFSHQGALAQTREAATAEGARLRAESAAEIARIHDLSAAEAARIRAEAAAEVARVREESATEIARVREETTAELARTREAAAAELAAAREQAAAEAAKAHEDAERALSALRDEAAAAAAQQRDEADQAARQIRDDVERTLADALRQRDELYGAASGMKEGHDRALEAIQLELNTAAAAHALAVELHASGASRVLESIRGLDGATSLTEVLDMLTSAVARESGRAATLVVKGDRLIGWRTSGLGAVDTEPRTLEANINDVGALAAAVNTTRPATAGHGSVLAAPAFAQLGPDQVGLAVPLIVGGRAVAVVYSDVGDTTPMPAWQATVEVLVRHAGRCLEAMTVQRAAQARATSVRVPASA